MFQNPSHVIGLSISISWVIHDWRWHREGVAPGTVVEIDQHFRGAYYIHHQGDDDGGSKYLWRVSQFLRDCTAQHPWRQSSSYSPLWESKISLMHLLLCTPVTTNKDWINSTNTLLTFHSSYTTQGVNKYKNQSTTDKLSTPIVDLLSVWVFF
jgi:hypothetical protein